MRTLLFGLLILLGLSLALNVYLLLQPSSTHTQTPGLNDTRPASPPLQPSEGRQQSPSDNNTRLTDSLNADSATAFPEQRQRWLTRLKEKLGAGQYGEVNDFLQRYLQQQPDDTDFLLLEGELIAQTQPINTALQHYYQLLDFPLTEQERAELNSKINEMVRRSVNQLRQLHSWDILATLLEPLWQLAPYDRFYTLNLAEAYARMDLAAPMENVLASVDLDDPDALRIRALLARNLTRNNTDTRDFADDTSQEALPPDDDLADSIPLTRYGDHFVVRGSAGKNVVDLMIDTGASTTVLTARAFENLRRSQRFRYVGEYLVNTAGGRVQAPVYQMRALTIGDAEVQNMAVVVLPMEDFRQADGLLGMNFLREFEFRIDQFDASLQLSPRK